MIDLTNKKGKNWWRTVGYFVKGNQHYEDNYLLDGDIVISEPKFKAEVLNNFFLKQNLVDGRNFHQPIRQPGINNANK